MEEVPNNRVFLLFLFLNPDVSWPHWLPFLFHLPSRLRNPGSGKGAGTSAVPPPPPPPRPHPHTHTFQQSCLVTFTAEYNFLVLRRKIQRIAMIFWLYLVFTCVVIQNVVLLSLFEILCGYKCCQFQQKKKKPVSVIFHCEPDETFH